MAQISNEVLRFNRIDYVKIWSLNPDGTTNTNMVAPGEIGFTYIFAGFESVSFKPRSKESENQTISTTSDTCEYEGSTSAFRYGVDVTLSMKGNSPALEAILGLSRPNFDPTDLNIITGDALTQYRCTQVAIEIGYNLFGKACKTGNKKMRLLIPYVEDWSDVSSEVTIDSGKEVPVYTYTGRSLLNAAFDDPEDFWIPNGWFQPKDFISKTTTLEDSPVTSCDEPVFDMTGNLVTP